MFRRCMGRGDYTGPCDDGTRRHPGSRLAVLLPGHRRRRARLLRAGRPRRDGRAHLSGDQDLRGAARGAARFRRWRVACRALRVQGLAGRQAPGRARPAHVLVPGRSKGPRRPAWRSGDRPGPAHRRGAGTGRWVEGHAHRRGHRSRARGEDRPRARDQRNDDVVRSHGGEGAGGAHDRRLLGERHGHRGGAHERRRQAGARRAARSERRGEGIYLSGARDLGEDDPGTARDGARGGARSQGGADDPESRPRARNRGWKEALPADRGRAHRRARAARRAVLRPADLGAGGRRDEPLRARHEPSLAPGPIRRRGVERLNAAHTTSATSRASARIPELAVRAHSEDSRMALEIGKIQTVVGTGKEGYEGDGGLASQALIGEAYGCAFDTGGHLYISDGRNHTIRRIDRDSGIITTVAGSGRQGYPGDGGPATDATLNNLYSLQVDTNGDIYIVDRLNAAIRKVDAATGIITTVVGTGKPGYAGDGGPGVLAQLREPNDCFSMAKAACSSRTFRTNGYAVWTSRPASSRPSPVMGRSNGPEMENPPRKLPSWAPAQSAWIARGTPTSASARATASVGWIATASCPPSPVPVSGDMPATAAPPSLQRGARPRPSGVTIRTTSSSWTRRTMRSAASMR